MKPCSTCDGTGIFCISMTRDFCMDCLGTGDAEFEPEEHTDEEHQNLMRAASRRAQEKDR